MIIDRISILNFKNIEEAELSFSPKMNYLFGNNGMGKTSLLDALFYLSFTKSHSSLLDNQIIRHEQEFCVLHGNYRDGDTVEDIYCGVKRKHRKVFKRNRKEYERMSEHIGLIPVVMVSPADMDLIHGGSDERRKFVDMVISQYDKDYLRTLIHYNKVLQQRNSLLRDTATLPDDSLFEIFDRQLAADGMFIHQKRCEFITGFLPVFRKYYQQICNESETVDLRYESQFYHADAESMLASRRQKDKMSGYTSVGVHKDDFLFLLDTYLIRKIGSQGQNKTYLIALKLAQFNFLAQKGHSVPILLLDDIFDKLDAGRVVQIIALAARSEFGQIFITDTNRKHLDEILAGMNYDYKLFLVENGKIEEMVNGETDLHRSLFTQ
ncbi:MAG: DNA replication and repair protein RecF [Dysgonamonadaceae bacterium]|jgi:DNA replication and repair protein RecF|nr:DNA replication and repair protein RecF [Dysgonamonadaceae bacterium]